MEKSSDFYAKSDRNDNEKCKVALEFVYDKDVSIKLIAVLCVLFYLLSFDYIVNSSFIISTECDFSNDNKSQLNLMNTSMDIYHSYFYQSTSYISNIYKSITKKFTSSPSHSSIPSNPIEYSLSPIGPSTNVK
ncbi:unnamed protein product, partial [Rotaria sp. Silwood2]